MKATKHIPAVLGLLLFLAVSVLSLYPSQTHAQAMPSWLGGGRIWDWSDFRGNVGFRMYMPKLISGTAKFGSNEYDMLGSGNFSYLPQPDFFKEGWFILYIDRLALRANFEEDHRFRGVVGERIFAHPNYGGPRTQTNPMRISEMDLGWTRFGIDLDVFRLPFLRAGINFDRHFESVILVSRQDVDTINFSLKDPNEGFDRKYNPFIPDRIGEKLTTHQPPVTLGVHAFASPGRLFGIPLTGQARARFPFPFLTKITGEPAEARITEWEVCVGLRPNIWNTSLYGYSSFAMGIDVGFKSTYLDMDSGDGVWNVKAHWQGPYVQVGLYY